jgi:hypothetical protein
MYLPALTFPILNYLDDYNTECEIYGVRSEHRAILLPRYCTHEIKEIVKLLPPCDWKLLPTEIKKFYWKSDHPKNSCAALNALIRESPRLPLNSYLLKFTTITDVLVASGVLTTVNRVDRLLERLDEKLRIKVIMFCTEKGWKVFDHDISETPNFDEIKKFLEHEVLTIDRISVYEHEPRYCADAISAISHSDTPTVPSPKTAITVRPASPTAKVPFLLNAPALDPTFALAPAATSAIPTSSSRHVPRVSRCIWCDSSVHSRRSEYGLFIDAMKTGNIRINEYGRVAFSSTGAEIPLL